MTIFWWQAGLHIDPETDEERRLLDNFYRLVKNIKAGFPDLNAINFSSSDNIGMPVVTHESDNQ